MIATAPIGVNPKSPSLAQAVPAADWCHLQHVRTLMGLSRRRFRHDEILDLIDSREIRWAWDISRASARRPEVRLWRDSLIDFLARESGGIPGGRAEETSLEQVIAAILPRGPALVARAATVRAAELQRRFLCCQTHLAGLIADGELCCVGQAGPRQSPVVLYQSAFEFLKRRCLSR